MSSETRKLPDASTSFGPAEFQPATGASPRAVEDMERYRALLADWSGRMNLVGPSALEAFWPRHALDCAQLLALAPEAKQWLDVGSGAGLPGVVLAILARDKPGMTVQLVDSIGKRAVFLRTVVEALDLPATVHHGRIETVKVAPPDVLTARAVAPLDRLLDLTQAYLKRGAVGLFHKGRNLDAEMAEALQTWRFDSTVFPSVSDPSGRILKLWSLRRASA
jgi:16S rRNA (guanine527-N7)-methyltransferase